MDAKQQAAQNSSTLVLLMNSENKKTRNDCYSQGDNVQISLRNRKPRLKWTKQLHRHFVQAVNQLGGAYEATPKNIVKLMGVQEITPNHIKSHLQKYRQSKELGRIVSTEAVENGMKVMPFEGYQENKYTTSLASETHKKFILNTRDTQMRKAEELSTEGQQNFKSQSEKSENFQQQVPCSEGKQLSAVLDRIPESTKGDDKDSEEAKWKKNKLSGPVIYQTQIHSLHSCVTFSRLTENMRDTYHIGAEIEPKAIEKKNKLNKDDPMWIPGKKEERPLYCSLTDGDGNVKVDAKRKLANDCTISTGLQFTKANNSSKCLEDGPKTRVEYYNNFCDLDRFSVEVDTKAANKSKLTNCKENGPLQSLGESKFDLNYQPFDLNISVLDEQL